MPDVIAGLIPNSPVPFRVTSTAQKLLDHCGLLCLYIRREEDPSEQSLCGLPTSVPFCSLPEAKAHCFLSLHRGILMLRVSANVYIGSFFCH